MILYKNIVGIVNSYGVRGYYTYDAWGKLLDYDAAASACSSHDHAHGPYILLSYGLDRKRADSTIRISLCAENSREEADALIAALNEGLSTLIRAK